MGKSAKDCHDVGLKVTTVYAAVLQLYACKKEFFYKIESSKIKGAKSLLRGRNKKYALASKLAAHIFVWPAVLVCTNAADLSAILNGNRASADCGQNTQIRRLPYSGLQILYCRKSGNHPTYRFWISKAHMVSHCLLMY